MRPITLWTLYIRSKPLNILSNNFNLVDKKKFIDKLEIAIKALNFAKPIIGFCIESGLYESQMMIGEIKSKNIINEPRLKICLRLIPSNSSTGKNPDNHSFLSILFLLFFRDFQKDIKDN